MEQNKVSSECNEEQMNQKEFQSKMEEPFSGFSSYYSTGTSVDCELENYKTYRGQNKTGRIRG